MDPLLRVENVSKSFSVKGNRKLYALKDVNLEVYKGETLGIVGESGCGKSTLARAIMGIYPNAEGKVYFHGELLNLKHRKNRLAFAEKVQMIFQDPYNSLNPRMTVEDIVGENLVIHKRLATGEKREKVQKLLESVGLQGEYGGRFPSEFSGGQRQRIGIARALAVEPELLVCDEPISALDVSIQSQIMNLLKRLGKELELTYIFIAHDLNMVHYLSDRVAVMYLGHIVELTQTERLYQTPRHPYTKRLLEAVLIPDPAQPGNRDLWTRTDEVPVAGNVGKGCPFADRCSQVKERCIHEKPVLKEVEEGHFAACHYAV